MDCMGFWEHQYPIVWLFTLLLNADHTWFEKNTKLFPPHSHTMHLDNVRVIIYQLMHNRVALKEY